MIKPRSRASQVNRPYSTACEQPVAGRWIRKIEQKVVGGAALHFEDQRLELWIFSLRSLALDFLSLGPLALDC